MDLYDNIFINRFLVLYRKAAINQINELKKQYIQDHGIYKYNAVKAIINGII